MPFADLQLQAVKLTKSPSAVLRNPSLQKSWHQAVLPMVCSLWGAGADPSRGPVAILFPGDLGLP